MLVRGHFPDHVYRVLDLCLKGKALERHEEVTDLLPREGLSVDDDQRQANFTVRIPLDASDEPMLRSQLPAELRALGMSDNRSCERERARAGGDKFLPITSPLSVMIRTWLAVLCRSMAP